MPPLQAVQDFPTSISAMCVLLVSLRKSIATK
jgi:hypothetical protein